MRLFLLLLLFSLASFAYTDSDMDGVPDADDHCLNTPMTDLVDLSGCTKKSLISPHHFSVIGGEGYAQESNDIYTFSSFELNYYYKKLSVQLTTGYYDLKSNDINSSGLNDTYLNLFYTFNPIKNFKLSLGMGIAFPTYDNIDNRTDYSTSLYGRYSLDKWSLSSGVGYRLIGDNNTVNTFYYNLGIGYSWSDKVYSSLSYSVSQSLYEGNEDLKSLSLYNYYNINKSWFATINYSHGLSDASLDNSIGVKIGYYW